MRAKTQQPGTWKVFISHTDVWIQPRSYPSCRWRRWTGEVMPHLILHLTFWRMLKRADGDNFSQCCHFLTIPLLSYMGSRIALQHIIESVEVFMLVCSWFEPCIQLRGLPSAMRGMWLGKHVISSFDDLMWIGKHIISHFPDFYFLWATDSVDSLPPSPAKKGL